MCATQIKIKAKETINIKIINLIIKEATKIIKNIKKKTNLVI